MDIKPVSPETRELEVLAARLEEGDLTLGEMSAIEDRASFALTDEKTRKLGESILVRVGSKREGLLAREIVKLDGRTDLASKVARLDLRGPTLTHTEAEEEILELIREAPLEEDSAVKETALDRLEEIAFMTEFPIAHEFDPKAVESTYMSRMTHLASMMREKHSLVPFKEGLPLPMQRRIIPSSEVNS